MGASNLGPPSTRADLRNPDLTVADVMRTDFRSCNASAPAWEVATALRVSGSPLLPVTRAQIPIGIVTEHGLALALAEHGGDLSSLSAGDLMSEEAPTIPIKAPIAEVIGRLAEAGGHLLAVNPEGMLQGVLTLSELGPQLSEAALGRLVARLAEGSGVPGSLGHGAPLSRPGGPPAPAEEACEADPTAEIKSSKSQAQPHPWDSPTRSHPEPIPLVSPSDLVNPILTVADVMTADPPRARPPARPWRPS